MSGTAAYDLPVPPAQQDRVDDLRVIGQAAFFQKLFHFFSLSAPEGKALLQVTVCQFHSKTSCLLLII